MTYSLSCISFGCKPGNFFNFKRHTVDYYDLSQSAFMI
jgi:hypothetical protein